MNNKVDLFVPSHFAVILTPKQITELRDIIYVEGSNNTF